MRVGAARIGGAVVVSGMPAYTNLIDPSAVATVVLAVLATALAWWRWRDAWIGVGACALCSERAPRPPVTVIAID